MGYNMADEDTNQNEVYALNVKFPGILLLSTFGFMGINRDST